MCQEKCNCFHLPGDVSITPMCCKADYKLVTREVANDMFVKNWCLKCGMFGTMETVRTNLPGIHAQTCKVCRTHYHVNTLESDTDEVKIPVNSVLPEGVTTL